MRCAWCGETLQIYDINNPSCGVTYECATEGCPASLRELAAPQMGSPLYDKVMKEQSDPKWKSILEVRPYDATRQP